MKNIIAVAFMLALLQADVRGWQNQSPSTTEALAQPASTPSPSQSSDAFVLRKGLPLCLLPTQTISTQTAKVGDHVTFKTGNDLSVEGLTVVALGTEVSATISKAKKPGNWSRNGSLAFTLDDLKLINGKTVPLRGRKEPKESIWNDPKLVGIVVLAPLLVPRIAHEKGLDASREPGTCLYEEIARKVMLNREEIAALQPEGTVDGVANWKTKVRQLLPQSLALDTSFHDLGAAQEIMEFNLDSGRERRLTRCNHCYGPVTCGKCGGALSTGFFVYFLDSKGLYDFYADKQNEEKSNTRNRLVAGRFTRILAIMDKNVSDSLSADIAVLQSSANSCRIVRVGRPLLQSEIIDSIECKEVTEHHSRPEIALRPGQIMNTDYVTDMPATSGVRSLAIGSLEATSALRKLSPATNLDSSFGRFDPVWHDGTRILYVREGRQTQEKH